MTEPWEDQDDDALLVALAAVLSSEPPPEVIEAAKEIFTWRTLEAELAELTFDSVLDAEPALARASAPPRILTFEAGGLTVEVEVDTGAGGRRLLGQLVPAQAAELELVGENTSVPAVADALGRFVVDLPDARQRVGLRVRSGAGRTVETPWLVL